MAKYVYIPGLAQPELVLSLSEAATDYGTYSGKVDETFGWLDGRSSPPFETGDPFMNGAVEALCKGKGATPVDCSRALNWVKMAEQVWSADKGEMVQKLSKAQRVLGAAQDNMLSLKPGVSASQKELEYDVDGGSKPCLAATYLGQRKSGAGTTTPLAKLAAGDTLYVVGHGNARGGTITYKCKPDIDHQVATGWGNDLGKCAALMHMERRYVDPVTVAWLLQDEGLPKAALTIEMVMCYAGGVALADQQTVQPFAQRLAGGLKSLGYDSVKVVGAMGLVVGETLEVQPGLTVQGDKLIIDTHFKIAPGNPAYGKQFKKF